MMLTRTDDLFQSCRKLFSRLKRIDDISSQTRNGMTQNLSDIGEPKNGAGRPGLRSQFFAGAVSVGAHVALLGAIFAFRAPVTEMLIPPDPPMAVVVDLTPPPATDAPSAKAPDPEPAAAPPVPPTPPQPPPKRAQKPPRPTEVQPIVAEVAPKPQPMPGLTEAQLAGATIAANGVGSGGEGSGAGAGSGDTICDMGQRLQAALRRDPEVRSAVINAHREAGASARAILLWDGDWIQKGGQEGKGLAGVRQAIALEIAFAPAACRAQTMRGLVVLQLNEAGGPGRLALGESNWRWSDLLNRTVARR